jgi:hypothetical protein
MKMGAMTGDQMATANNSLGFNTMNGDRVSMGGRMSARSDEDSTKADTTYYPYPWYSCATITNTINPDGSTTTTYDYGAGCEEGYDPYKYTLFGKYSFTNKYSLSSVGSVYKSDYSYEFISDNFGGKYYYDTDTTEWSSSGYSKYTGSSVYDTADNTYSGSYESINDNIYTSNGEQFIYKGHGKGYYNEHKSVIETNDYTYSSTDYYYNTHVIEPLVMNFDCRNNMLQTYDGTAEYAKCYIMPIYVSGREFVTYKDKGKEGSFEIYYGDGECDSIITIIENGKAVTMDAYSSTENSPLARIF